MSSTNVRALTLHSAADVTEAWERKMLQEKPTVILLKELQPQL